MTAHRAIAFAIALSSCEGSHSVRPAPSPSSLGAMRPEITSSTMSPTAASPRSTTPVTLAEATVKAVPLPGASGPASLDYIVYEQAASRVWVPAGSTGSVDVLDVRSGSLTRIEGFKTAEREGHGRKRIVGPSAASVGDGFVYIGNRATSEVCPIDVKTLAPSACITLPSPTDGVAYVASAKEVWVTTPKDESLRVLGASKPGTLVPKAVIKVPGAPEGYAVDDARGLFFTNLEDKGKTLAIDVKTRKVRATWNPSCNPDGPRGLAMDSARSFLIVACTDHVQVLDTAHDGAPRGKLDTGAGVDSIDYSDAGRLLYVAAGKAARLTVVRLDDEGQLTVVSTTTTSEGARNAVADAGGNAYVTDSQNARLLVVSTGKAGR